jgi:hypothetical protein
MGIVGDALSFAGPAVDGLFNLGSTIYGNEVMWQRAKEGSGMVDSLNADIDNEYGNWVNADPFGGNLDASRFGRGQFEDQTDWSGLLQGMNAELNTAEGRANSYLTGQMIDPMTAASRAGSFLSDAETDAYLRNALNDANSESKNRLGTAQQDTISRVLGSGRSLAESRDAMAALNYNEGVNRSNAVDAAQAGAETIRNQNRQVRAGLQNQAMLGQASTNAGLATSQAQIAGDLATGRSNNWFNVNKAKSDAYDQDQAQAFDAYQALLDRYGEQNTEAYNRAMDFLGMKQQNILSQAGMISGVDFTIPQTTVGRDMYQNWMGREQMAANRAKGSANVSILGTGGGGGCIAADSLVSERSKGLIPQCSVEPGDEVLSDDGEFYPVVGKDCGTVEPEMRHDLVRIVAGDAILEATPDHVVDGKPAGQWRPGEKLRIGLTPAKVEQVILVPYRPSGDLLLAGNRAYIANGFVVHSNIGRGGLAAWYKHVASLDSEHAGEDNGFVSSTVNPTGVWALAE